MTSKVTRTRKPKAGGLPSVEPCACCGIAPGVGGKPLAVTFEEPDVIHDIHPELLQVWGGDPFAVIKDVGFFVRVVLPIKLSDGFAVDFGTWLEVSSEDFRKAWQTWNFPEYKDLVIEGYLANVIAPWPEFPHALVKASVRDLDEVPVVTSSSHGDVMAIMNIEWPHARILTPYADMLRAEPMPAATDVSPEASRP
jgi:hypothetical protein